MNGLYQFLLAVHVIVAVLGLGSIGSVVILAASARSARRDLKDVSPWLSVLLRYSTFSLVLMLVTGIALDLVMRGAFHNLWWFRGSAVLFFATGALHGQARRALRQGSGGDGEAILRRVGGLAWAMCALIAAITVLMEVKPF